MSTNAFVALAQEYGKQLRALSFHAYTEAYICCRQVFVPDEMARASVCASASLLTVSDALLYDSHAIEQVRKTLAA